jgi:hypothetical protein
VVYAVFPGKVYQQMAAPITVARLKAAGLVINARMDYPRVSAGLVLGQGGFFLKNTYPVLGMFFLVLIGGGQSYHAAPYYG